MRAHARASESVVERREPTRPDLPALAQHVFDARHGRIELALELRTPTSRKTARSASENVTCRAQMMAPDTGGTSRSVDTKLASDAGYCRRQTTTDDDTDRNTRAYLGPRPIVKRLARSAHSNVDVGLGARRHVTNHLLGRRIDGRNFLTSVVHTSTAKTK